MPTFTTLKQKKDIKVSFNGDTLYVEWEGGKTQAFPLMWHPKLKNASDEERNDWTLTADGIHWNKLDETITLAGI